MITLESYQQTYAYDTGNNLTNLSHQANSNTWQQTLTIALTLLGQDLKKSPSGQKLDFANHPYLCKGLYLSV
jgi:hypothetical protein